MDYSVYKAIHLLSLMMIFLSLGALVMHSSTNLSSSKKWVMVTHGIATALAFITGFGLIAKTKIPYPWPDWVWIKLTVWIMLAGAPALIRRKPQLSQVWWCLILCLAGLAIFSVVILRTIA